MIGNELFYITPIAVKIFFGFFLKPKKLKQKAGTVLNKNNGVLFKKTFGA